MALAIIFIGILLIASAVKGTEHTLGQLLETDLTGQNGFIVWIAAIVTIGLIGKIPGFAGPAKAMLALVFVVILIGNPTFFKSLQDAFTSASTSGPIPSVSLSQSGTGSSSGGVSSSVGNSSGSGQSSTISDVEKGAAIAAVLLV